MVRGTCAIAAFDDYVMKGIPGINCSDQFAIYPATAEKKDTTLR
jgi:hypothetical protein